METPEDYNSKAVEALDFERIFTELKEYAKAEGIDLEPMIERASAHYTSDEIKPRTEPLTKDEVEALIKADEELLGSFEDEFPLSCEKGGALCSENTGR